MNERAPVKDWKTDWDHLDTNWRNDPYPIWDKLRKECPIAHTERFEGAYLPTRYEDVKAISYDTKRFSSHRLSYVTSTLTSQFRRRQSPPTRPGISPRSACCCRSFR